MTTLVLAALAIVVTSVTCYSGQLPATKGINLGFNLVGTALLASAFTPTDVRGVGFWNRQIGSGVVLLRPEFYGGLSFLAISAVMGALR